MTSSYYVDYLRAAHQRQETDYVGKPKRRLQQLWLAAAVNLKGMFKLAEIRTSYLTTILTPVCEVNMTAEGPG